jgi:hypothetical protein
MVILKGVSDEASADTAGELSFLHPIKINTMKPARNNLK